jgi:hypothetical protein
MVRLDDVRYLIFSTLLVPEGLLHNDLDIPCRARQWTPWRRVVDDDVLGLGQRESAQELGDQLHGDSKSASLKG